MLNEIMQLREKEKSMETASMKASAPTNGKEGFASCRTAKRNPKTKKYTKFAIAMYLISVLSLINLLGTGSTRV